MRERDHGVSIQPFTDGWGGGVIDLMLQVVRPGWVPLALLAAGLAAYEVADLRCGWFAGLARWPCMRPGLAAYELGLRGRGHGASIRPFTDGWGPVGSSIQCRGLAPPGLRARGHGMSVPPFTGG
jgi:hypothetical protein